MNLKTLFEPNPRIDDAKLATFCKMKGPMRIKLEGVPDKSAISKAEDVKYYVNHDKGRIIAFFSDNPSKGGKLISVLAVSFISDILEESKQRPGFTDLKLGTEAILAVKIEDKKAKADWLKALRYIKTYYKNDKPSYESAYTSHADPELNLNIYADFELSDWKTAAPDADFSSLFKDKGLLIILENNLPEIVRNRLVVAPVQEELKDKRGSLVADLGVEEKRGSINANRRASTLNFGTNDFYLVLISQRPVNIVDEEFNASDDAIMEKEGLPEWMEFNRLYFFSHSAPGDITPYIRSLSVA